MDIFKNWNILIKNVDSIQMPKAERSSFINETLLEIVDFIATEECRQSIVSYQYSDCDDIDLAPELRQKIIEPLLGKFDKRKTCADVEFNIDHDHIRKTRPHSRFAILRGRRIEFVYFVIRICH